LFIKQKKPEGRSTNNRDEKARVGLILGYGTNGPKEGRDRFFPYPTRAATKAEFWAGGH